MTVALLHQTDDVLSVVEHNYNKDREVFYALIFNFFCYIPSELLAIDTEISNCSFL